ncbi:MAG: hypothetical protein NVS3B26_25420 [Mycobacteriales bacterium]
MALSGACSDLATKPDAPSERPPRQVVERPPLENHAHSVRLIGSKIAIAVAASTVAVGGVTAAATSSLPDPLQQAAHNLAGAPAPTSDSTAAPTTETAPTVTASPDSGSDPATGPAAYGLCTAYTHGGVPVGSSAYQSLVLAAGTADGIKAYCATVKSPRQAASHRPSSRPTGAPSSRPTGAPSSRAAAASGAVATPGVAG